MKRELFGAALLGLALAACGDGGGGAATDAVDAVDTTEADTVVGADTATDDVADSVLADTAADNADTAADVTFDVDEPTDVLPALTGAIALEIGLDDGGVRVQPSVALGADGRLVVAFTGKVGDSLGIFAGVYDASRGLEEVVAPYVVNVDRRGLQNEPVVCALRPADGFVVGWSSDTQEVGPDGENNEIRVRLLDVTGAPRSTGDLRILTDRPGNHWLLSLACEPGGGFAVAAVRPSAEADHGFAAFVQRFDGDGVARGAAIDALPGSYGQLFPVVGAGADGAVVVAWEEQETAETFTKSVARVFAPPPTEPSEVLTVATASLADAGGAFLAVDPGSSRFVAGGVAGTRMRLAHFEGATRTSLAFQEASNVPIPTGALAAAGDDRYAVVYLDGLSGDVNAKVAYIRDGAIEAPAILGTGRYQPAYQPAIDVRNGRVIAAWTESLGQGAYMIRGALIR